eukprot:COSAG03_NODE_3032_length_2276_cov_9.150207_1_plen_173_part_10
MDAEHRIVLLTIGTHIARQRSLLGGLEVAQPAQAKAAGDSHKWVLMQRFLASINASSSDSDADSDDEQRLSVFQALELHGLAEPAQIQRMRQNIREGRFTMDHYESVWAPKLAQMGLGGSAGAKSVPAAAAVAERNQPSLFQALELHGLAEPAQIQRMRQNIREGRFTMDHYE